MASAASSSMSSSTIKKAQQQQEREPEREQREQQKQEQYYQRLIAFANSMDVSPVYFSIHVPLRELFMKRMHLETYTRETAMDQIIYLYLPRLIKEFNDITRKQRIQLREKIKETDAQLKAKYKEIVGSVDTTATITEYTSTEIIMERHQELQQQYYDLQSNRELLIQEINGLSKILLMSDLSDKTKLNVSNILLDWIENECYRLQNDKDRR